MASQPPERDAIRFYAPWDHLRSTMEAPDAPFPAAVRLRTWLSLRRDSHRGCRRDWTKAGSVGFLARKGKYLRKIQEFLASDFSVWPNFLHSAPRLIIILVINLGISQSATAMNYRET